MSVKEKKTNISFGNKDNKQNMKSAGALKKNVFIRMKSNPSSSRDEIKAPPPQTSST